MSDDRVAFEIQLTETQAGQTSGPQGSDANSSSKYFDKVDGEYRASLTEEALRDLKDALANLSQSSPATSGPTSTVTAPPTAHGTPPPVPPPVAHQQPPPVPPPVQKPPVQNPPGPGPSPSGGPPSPLTAIGSALGMTLTGVGLIYTVSRMADAISEKFDSIVQGITDFTTSPRRGDPTQAGLGVLSRGASMFDGPEALFGINTNLIDDAIKTLIGAVQKLIQNFDELSETMGQFSGPVMVAMAERDVARFRTEMYRAEELGSSMADYVRARTQGSEDLERLKIQIEKLLLPLATGLVEKFGGLAGSAADLMEELTDPEFGRAFLRQLPGFLKPLFEPIVKYLEELERNKRLEQYEYDEILSKFLSPGSLFDAKVMPPEVKPKELMPTVPFGAPGTGAF